jgi:hypothetical protein
VVAPAPTAAELATVVARVASRMVRWQSRHGHLEERDDHEANAERPAGWLQLSLAGGTFAKLNADGEESEDRDEADSWCGAAPQGGGEVAVGANDGGGGVADVRLTHVMSTQQVACQRRGLEHRGWFS